MDEVTIKNILDLILKRLGNQKVLWMLDGSVNLVVQGVNIKPDDLDITTDEKGQNIFKKLFREFIKDESYNNQKDKYAVILEVENHDVEVSRYGGREPYSLDKIAWIRWKRLKLPVMPLKYAKDFYERIGRKEKATLIDNFINK